MSTSVLFVLTSHDQLGDTGKPTGFWLEELAAPYYRLIDRGVAVTLASPRGGQPPLDPSSELADFQTDATRRFTADAAAQAALAATKPLDAVSADAFDAIFYPGGHGPLWDLHGDERSIALIEAFWQAGKPVAAVCHAPCVLLRAKDAAGEPLVKGRRVTAFSNGEEAAVGLTEAVPYLLEDELRGLGADYSREPDFAPHVAVDGLLITGQNPASSAPAADALLAALGVEAS